MNIPYACSICNTDVCNHTVEELTKLRKENVLLKSQIAKLIEAGDNLLDRFEVWPNPSALYRKQWREAKAACEVKG